MISWQPNNILMNLKIMYLSSENKLLSLVIILGAIRYSLLFVTYSFQILSKSQWIAFWKPRGFVIIALRLLLFLRKLESNYLNVILLYLVNYLRLSWHSAFGQIWNWIEIHHSFLEILNMSGVPIQMPNVSTFKKKNYLFNN